MNTRLMSFIAIIAIVPASAFAQGLPPLGPATQQQPNTLPALNGQGAIAPASGLSLEALNADLKSARAANQEKRFADAEAVMLRDTAVRPHNPYLWLELGQAQLGQKKYAESETSYKAALSSGDPVKAPTSSASFYSADNRTVSHASGGAAAPPVKGIDMHEVQGSAFSGLGEIYIRLNRIPEAKEAFDQAAAAFPSQAALYYRNETILFLQTGNAMEQVAAADKAISVDPSRAALYFFKGQGLAAQATIDAKTQKLILPNGSAEALQRYLELEPAGSYSADTTGMLAAAGIAVKVGKK